MERERGATCSRGLPPLLRTSRLMMSRDRRPMVSPDIRPESEGVCVCVCVRERERERELAADRYIRLRSYINTSEHDQRHVYE